MKILDEVFCSQPLDAWRARLDQHAVTFGIIARIDDLPNDPQLVANGIFRPVEGKGVREGLRTVDSPIQLDRHPKPPARRRPRRASTAASCSPRSATPRSVSTGWCAPEC